MGAFQCPLSRSSVLCGVLSSVSVIVSERIIFYPSSINMYTVSYPHISSVQKLNEVSKVCRS